MASIASRVYSSKPHPLLTRPPPDTGATARPTKYKQCENREDKIKRAYEEVEKGKRLCMCMPISCIMLLVHVLMIGVDLCLLYVIHRDLGQACITLMTIMHMHIT